MTATRQQVVFNLQDTEIRPDGLTFSARSTRQATNIRTVGYRHMTSVAYGKFSGSWSCEFPMTFDVDCLSMLRLFFDGTEISAPEGTDAGYYEWDYSCTETQQPYQFSVTAYTLGKITGAVHDWVSQYTGCVCTNFQIKYAGGDSRIFVIMSGKYTDEKIEKRDLTDEEIAAYFSVRDAAPDVHRVEWAQLHMKDKTGNDVPVAETTSMDISISVNRVLQYSAMQPVAVGAYSESAEYRFSVTCYSDDPDRFINLVHRGGRRDTDSAQDPVYPYASGLFPMDEMSITSTTDAYIHGKSTEPMADSMTVTVTECVMKSVTTSSSLTEAMMDKLTSLDCRKITIHVIAPYRQEEDA